jgi:hypothetical protein
MWCLWLEGEGGSEMGLRLEGCWHAKLWLFRHAQGLCWWCLGLGKGLFLGDLWS